MLRALFVLLMIVLFGTGCSDGGSDEDAGPVATSVTTDTSVPVDAASGDVALPPDGEPFLELSGELYVTSDGTVYRAVEEPMGMAPVAMGGPTWEVAALTDAGRARLLEFLDEQGFFTPPPDYSELMVTDVNPNRLIVTTAAATYEHEAFVDYVDESDGGEDFDRFRAVLEGLRDLPTVVGDGLGAFEPYVPETWDVVDRLGAAANSVVGELERWAFSAPAVEGCTSFPDDDVTAGGVDGATGRYDTGRQVLDVVPRFPWDGPC